MAWRAHLTHRYAGLPVEAVQPSPDELRRDITTHAAAPKLSQNVFTLDGAEYYLCRGVLMPYYPLPCGPEAFLARSRIVTALNHRIDSAASVDRHEEFTREQIDDLAKRYAKACEASEASPLAQALGAELVLHMLSYIERVDKALIDQRHNMRWSGVRTLPLSANLGELAHHYETKSESEQKNVRHKLKETRSALSRFLSTEPDLVGCLRRQRKIAHLKEARELYGKELYDVPAADASVSGYFDYQGALSDMIREVVKASSFNSEGGAAHEREQTQTEALFESIEKARLVKIADAIACIHAITARMEKACALDAETYANMTTTAKLESLADHACALLSMRGENHRDEAQTRADLYSIVGTLKRQHQEVLEARSEAKRSLAAEGGGHAERANPEKKQKAKDAKRISKQSLNVLEFGLELILDMVQTGLPCNEIFWPAGEEPARVARQTDCKVPDTRNIPHAIEMPAYAKLVAGEPPTKDRLLSTDLRTCDPRSSMALFEKFSNAAMYEIERIQEEARKRNANVASR